MRPILTILCFAFCLLQQTSAQLSIEYLDSLGKAAYYNENYNKALRYYQQMLQKIKEDGAVETHLGNIQHVAILYLELGRYEEAEALCLQLIQVQQKRKNTQNLLYVQCLGQLAYCYYGQGKYDEAEPYYLNALAIGKQVLEEDAPTNNANLNNLALLYTTMKRYDEAEQIYLQLIELDRRNVHTKQYYATSLNNLAVLYYETKRYTEAQKLCLEALKTSKNIYGDDHPNYALSLNNLAALFEKMHLNDDAELLYIEAQQILGKNNPHYKHSLNSLAKLYYHQGNHAQAEKKWLETLNLTQDELGKEHPSYAQCLDNLAMLYLSINRLDTAWNYCLAGLAANTRELELVIDWKKLGTFTYYSNERASESIATLLAISKAQYEQYKSEANLKNVYEISKIGMQINERIRNDFSSNSNKLQALTQNDNFVNSGIKSIVDLKSEALLAEAFSFAEQNKSILLLDALKGQRARVLGDLPDSLALLELNLHHQKENLQQEQEKVSSEGEKAILATALSSLNLEIDAFIKSIKDKYPKYHALKYEHLLVNAKEVQELLDEQTLLLEFFVGKEQSYLFVVAKKTVEIIPINISKTKLSEKVKELRDALSNYAMLVTAPEAAYLAYTKSATWMYQELLQKALENKKENRLMIITDGELGHLPFEVFLTNPAPQAMTDYSNLDYLVKQYRISYNYSASLWKENLESSKRGLQKDKKQELLAFAGSYDKPSNNLLSLRSKQAFQLRNTLENLPAAEEEVKMLSKSFYGLFLSGKEANEANFKKLATPYSVIHLAMHGVLNEAHPALSSLAFSEDFHRTEDNFLQAYEISQLQLNADLVVLSACQTGYGQFEEGEGVLSLARSFMYAGVPSLVVSLWQVNDQATAIIMSFFYQNLATQMPKDEALRQAKLKYLDTYTGSATHPALWSAFIQLGDSRPIFLETKKRWVLPLMIGVGVVLLGLGYWKYRR